MQHRVRQRGTFGVSHAVQENGHQQRSALVIGNVAAGNAAHEEFDFFTREFTAVALLANDVLWSHLAGKSCNAVFRLRRKLKFALYNGSLFKQNDGVRSEERRVGKECR